MMIRMIIDPCPFLENGERGEIQRFIGRDVRTYVEIGISGSDDGRAWSGLENWHSVAEASCIHFIHSLSKNEVP